MNSVIIVLPTASEPAGFAIPAAEAFEAVFRRLGWRISFTREWIENPREVIAGWGWRPIMRGAWERWPERILHCDLGFWGRGQYMKLALGDRWSPLSERDYDDTRLRKHGVQVMPSRKPGKRVLVCGMSAKAADTWGLALHQWEVMAARRLLAAGATVTYRPKPGSPPDLIPGTSLDQTPDIQQIWPRFDAVVSHHSNAAVDALAAGLPIYVETGIAKPLSVRTIEDAVMAEAPDLETRSRFLRQVAWHQWTLKELSDGAWLKPPAPLADHPILCGA